MISDIRQLDLNLLKALDILLDERSVTRAADRLALSQPAVSGILTRLRDSFDDPLFVRTQRGLTPTPRALALAAPIKAIINQVESILHPPEFIPEQAEITVKIACTDYALEAIIVPFLSVLRQKAPNIRIAVLPVDSNRLQSQFEHGEIDFALVASHDAPDDLHFKHLFDEEYVCFLRKNHPAAKKHTLSLSQFCAQDHALVSYTGGSFSGVTDEALAAIGKQRRVILSVKSFLVLPQILRESDLIAVVPGRLTKNKEGLCTLPPPLAIPGFTKTLLWHERIHRDCAYQWIRNLLFTVTENL